MTATGRVPDEPPPAAPLFALSNGSRLTLGSVAATLVAAAVTLSLYFTGRLVPAGAAEMRVVALGVCAGSIAAVLIGLTARLTSSRAGRELAHDKVASFRHLVSRSNKLAWRALSLQFAMLVLTAGMVGISANRGAIYRTFLQWHLMRVSFSDVLKAFKINVIISLVAEPLVLVVALLLAIVRLLPGPTSRAARALAIGYVDAFRGLPVIIVVYMVGFGLPLTGLPFVANLPAMWYAITALTLTYSAYVAEVLRAAVESIHPSQMAAARSLGLSHLQAMRLVIVPQATRSATAPLLSYFVALQKDTSLIGVVGTVEVFQQARIYSSSQFNLSSVTLASILFVLITIPQTRLADWLVTRGRRRRGMG